jgi:hypothetical protein
VEVAMKIGYGVLLVGALWLNAAGVWAAQSAAGSAPATQTTITLGCFSNVCSADLAAAIKAGDPKAALDAGGSAQDVVTAAINAQTAAGRQVMGLSGPALLAQIKPGSVRFGGLNKDGQPSASFDLQDGRGALMIWATVSMTAGAPAKLAALIYALPSDLHP